jgi:hypothetical protein
MARGNDWLKETLRAVPAGGNVEIRLPRFGRRDAYLKINGAAHAVWGVGNYTLRMARGDFYCSITHTPRGDVSEIGAVVKDCLTAGAHEAGPAAGEASLNLAPRRRQKCPAARGLFAWVTG